MLQVSICYLKRSIFVGNGVHHDVVARSRALARPQHHANLYPTQVHEATLVQITIVVVYCKWPCIMMKLT